MPSAMPPTTGAIVQDCHALFQPGYARLIPFRAEWAGDVLHNRAVRQVRIATAAVHERVVASLLAENQGIHPACALHVDHSSSAVRAGSRSPAAPRSTVWAPGGPHAAPVLVPSRGLREQLVHRLAGGFTADGSSADLSTGNLVQGPEMDQELVYAQGTL